MSIFKDCEWSEREAVRLGEEVEVEVVEVVEVDGGGSEVKEGTFGFKVGWLGGMVAPTWRTTLITMATQNQQIHITHMMHYIHE